jgi:predicted ATPase
MPDSVKSKQFRGTDNLMGALECISVKGFKSLADVELKLGAINVIIGPNGSGKSNFIGVFSFLHSIREGRLRDYVARAGGAEQLLHFVSKTTKAIEIHLSFGSDKDGYSLNLSPTSNDGLFTSGEYILYPHAAESQSPAPPFEIPPPVGNEAGISDANITGGGIFIREELASWRLYHLHDTSSSSPMKKTAELNDNRFLRPDGSNLASFLYYLRQEHSDSYKMIRNAIQRVAPFFSDFVLAPKNLNRETILLEWRHKKSDQYFDASSLSDGTLRFIGLATLFLQPEYLRPSVIVVDEPELGLHPYAITLLGSLIKSASKSKQVIVSTQSSVLLDQFEPEDILVADRWNDATTFTRLDPVSLAEWLEEYSLGQLWEKNELGGRP